MGLIETININKAASMKNPLFNNPGTRNPTLMKL